VNNPKTLKIVIGFLIVTLIVMVSLLVYAQWRNSMWMAQIDGLARFAGSTSARNDFQAGKLRLFTFAGPRDADAFSGTNDGPFEIWYSQYFPKDPRYQPFRYSKEHMVKSYNDTMKYLQGASRELVR
jgi:hypothetical protein